jgi:hypothetical protein
MAAIGAEGPWKLLLALPGEQKAAGADRGWKPLTHPNPFQSGLSFSRWLFQSLQLSYLVALD